MMSKMEMQLAVGMVLEQMELIMVGRNHRLRIVLSAWDAAGINASQTLACINSALNAYVNGVR